MSSYEQSTGFLVVRTARSMKKVLDARLAEYGITSSQHSVLDALAQKDGLSLSEIGKRVYLDKPAITGLADRLEKDGYVVRKRTARDRRVIHLWLTDKGRQLLKEFEDVVATTDQELIQQLSPEELGSFRNMLNRIWKQANNRSTTNVS
ncbi:MAG: MarR family winged helix-turn-helix transcriptional regulator [Fidelibacterota bacterium]